MAIVVQTYTLVNVSTLNQQELTRAPAVMSVFLWTYYNQLRGVKLVGSENEDDIGDSHEQHIELRLLPEAVGIKFAETSKNMRALHEEALKRQKEMTHGHAHFPLHGTTHFSLHFANQSNRSEEP